MPPSTEKRVPRLFLFFGMFILFCGFYSLIQKLNFCVHSVKTSGFVIAVDESATNDGLNQERKFYPQLEFRAEDNKTYRFTGEVASDPGRYIIGRPLPIRYLKHDPSQAKIDLFDELWLGTLLIFVLGCGFTGLGLAAYRGVRQANARARH